MAEVQSENDVSAVNVQLPGANPVKAPLNTPKHYVENLHLRKIIKENHHKSIDCIAFNTFREDQRHMLATAGGNQINIYDNQHCGNHLDLSCHFINAPTEYSKGGECSVCAFLLVKEPLNEALIAFGGESNQISVMSIAETRVVRLLLGHEGDIIDIAPHNTRPGCFFSASRDNTIRFWNAESDQPEQIFEAGKGLECIAAHPTSDSVIAGFRDGSVKKFCLGSGAAESLCKSQQFKRIDCIQFVDAERAMLHTVKGWLEVFNAASGELINKMKVPGNQKKEVSTTRFGISDCREFVCCGNDEGEAYIFNINEAKKVSKLSMPRIKGAVLNTVFTKNCKSVVVTTDDVIWRWDYYVAPPSSDDESVKK